MNFVAFAAEHGLIITNLIAGRWVRCATTDKPNGKQNGAYIFEGTSGAIQNWAVHEKPISWRDKNAKPVSREVIMRNMERVNRERKERQEKAAKKAGWIMHHAKCDHHPYLTAKGLPHEKGWVWEGKLVVPMRIDGHLVGCQTIDENGVKKFLYGQQSKNALAQISSKGRTIYTEGYATALSVKAAMKHLNLRYNIIICFSASNIVNVASKSKDGFVVADNDPNGAGLNAALKTKLPYWISDNVGQDFNDYHNAIGLERAADSLLNKMMGI
jgi:putative DNA primase/helicase